MQATNAILGIMNMGWPEITIIIVIVVLLFGAKKLPELARGVGKSIKEFRKATSNVEEEIRGAIEEEKPSTPPPASSPPAQTQSSESSTAEQKSS